MKEKSASLHIAFVRGVVIDRCLGIGLLVYGQSIGGGNGGVRPLRGAPCLPLRTHGEAAAPATAEKNSRWGILLRKAVLYPEYVVLGRTASNCAVRLKYLFVRPKRFRRADFPFVEQFSQFWHISRRFAF